MGIFDNIVGALRDTNEAAHGARLKRDVFTTLDLVHAAGPTIETESLRLYLDLQRQILAKCESWSRDGKLKVAAQLQSKARENKDFDIGQAYGYYLASAFVESMARESPDAKMTFLHLGTIAEEIEKQLNQQVQSQKSRRKTPDTFSMVDVCMTGILTATFWPPSGERTTEDFMPKLEELPLDGKILIVCVAFGVADAIGQKTGQSQAATLATMTAFLGQKLNYVEHAIPGIIRDLMTHSGKPGTKKYDYIRLGGRAAISLMDDPDDLEPLSECGFKVREILDASFLW